MPCLDNFGGPNALDAMFAEFDAYIERITADDPGCGTCAHYLASDYSDDHGLCRSSLADRARRYRDGITNQCPIPELVESHGYVPCDYETYEEG